MMKFKYGLILLVFLVSCKSEKKVTLSETRPNILFILADDLGYGDLGCYGQEIIETSTIDELASEGMRFTQFYAGGPVCTSSRACLMTGKHNGNTIIKTMEKPLGDEELTLGEVLQSAGYYTGAIGKWGLGGIDTEGLPSSQGFDFFYGYHSHIRAHNSYPDYLYRNGQKDSLNNEVIYITDSTHYAVGIGNAATKKNTYSNDVFTKEALSFIENKPGNNPFFLYLAYTIPHANNESWLIGECGMEVPDYGKYAEERSWPEAKIAGAAMISYLDNYVKLIVNHLEEQGLADNTLILISSDNGPHGEGGWNPDFFDSNGIYRGMKRDLYEGGIRVPFIAYWPGKILPGVNEDICTFWDVLPSFADLAGQQKTPSDGKSILPLLEGLDWNPRQDTLYWEFRTSSLNQAVRVGDFKAIRMHKNGVSVSELYNLREDVVEERNLAEAFPEKLKQLELIMDSYK